MWQKYVILVILFVILSLLQNSFFAHFLLLGQPPNLVFALFFIIIFFSDRQSLFETVFFSIIAGFLLDTVSLAFVGVLIVLLLGVAALLGTTRSWLKNFKERHPLIYFLPLFLIFFLAYSVFFNIASYFLNTGGIADLPILAIMGSLVYTGLAASGFYFVMKKFFSGELNNRQQKLFK